MKAAKIADFGLLLLAVICGFCSWYYQHGILKPFLKRHGAALYTQTSDLYPGWLGIRAALYERRNPYSDEVTRQIQIGYYGRALHPEEHRDEQRFAYPGHAVILLAPLALMPFHIAALMFAVILVILTIASVLLWLRVLSMRVRKVTLLAIILAVVGAWPVAQGVETQQVTLMVAFLLALACFLCATGRFALAGPVLVAATIKPQLSLPLVLWLFAWCGSDWRRRRVLILTFALSAFALLLTTELIVPQWLPYWLSSLREYARYTGSKLDLQFLLGTPAGAITTALITILCGYILWRMRVYDSVSEEFRFSIALVCAVTIFVMPTSSWHTYNQVLLIPTAFYVLRNWRCAAAGPITTVIAHTLAVVELFWGYLAALYLTCMHLLGTRFNNELQLAIPTYNFLLVAPLSIIAIVLLGNVAIRRPAIGLVSEQGHSDACCAGR